MPASTGRAGLSPLGHLVRRRDPDRFLTTLFAPPDRRQTLFALYAFNDELARAWEVASQPLLALIRLQWWREVIEGADRRHDIASPLMAEINAGRLQTADLLDLVAARERPEHGFDSAADWRDYFDASAGGLAEIAGKVLGATVERGRLRALGAAYGAAGHLRGAVVWGVEMSTRPPPELRVWAREIVGRPAPIPRGLVAAGLVGVLARRDLRHPDRLRPRGLGDRLAVLAAAAAGRV